MNKENQNNLIRNLVNQRKTKTTSSETLLTKMQNHSPSRISSDSPKSDAEEKDVSHGDSTVLQRGSQACTHNEPPQKIESLKF